MTSEDGAQGGRRADTSPGGVGDNAEGTPNTLPTSQAIPFDPAATRAAPAAPRAPERIDEVHQYAPTYPEILAGLTTRVTGHRQAMQELALAFDPRWATRASAVRERVVLIGASGVGKSHIVDALAETLTIPTVCVDASALAESGWQGMQPADVMTRLYQAVDGDLIRLEAGGVLLILDELDKLCPRHVGDAQSAAVREGRQQSLLSLMGGITPVRFTVEETTRLGERQLVARAARTDRLPILCAGSFPGLEIPHTGRVTDEALISYGMIPELASRLTTRIVLASRTPAELVAMWSSETGIVAKLSLAANAFGYELQISPEALACAGRAASRVDGGMTPRGAGALLSAATRTALIHALGSGAPPRTRLVIAPDDLDITI